MSGMATEAAATMHRNLSAGLRQALCAQQGACSNACPVRLLPHVMPLHCSSPSAVCSAASGCELAKSVTIVCWLSHVMLLHCTP